MRICSRCPGRAQENHAYCKRCQAAYYQDRRKIPGWLKRQARKARKFRRDNPEHMKVLYRRNNLKNSSGATVEWYEAKFKEQKGRCAICCAKAKPVRKGGIPRLCSDHDHETGELRALLCVKCNFAISRLEEVPDWHDRALAYLASWQ